MAKGNIKFTARVRGAVDTLVEHSNLKLMPVRSGSLFSPVLRGGNYLWIKVMDSDGLLVGGRRVKDGEKAGAGPQAPVDLLIGVVIQSEDMTSQTKPNPLGKASIGSIENGVWVDLLPPKGTKQGFGRRRLDRVHVLMLLPKGAAPKQQAPFNTAKCNVENAADMMRDCRILEVPRGIKESDLVAEIAKGVGRFFKGRGRPGKNRRGKR